MPQLGKTCSGCGGELQLIDAVDNVYACAKCQPDIVAQAKEKFYAGQYGAGVVPPTNPVPVDPSPEGRKKANRAHTRKPRNGNKMTAPQAVELVLKENGRPMHVVDILADLKKRDLWNTGSITPIMSLTSSISQAIKKGSNLKRIGPAVFALKN